MEEKINFIKERLGAGSINIFGLPLSGKDTVGVRLAQDLGGRFLSSGLILRTAGESDPELQETLSQGLLVPSAKFLELVPGYFEREDLRGLPLVLSSVGRWSGEEFQIMEAAKASGHPIKAVILLSVSEAEIRSRWEVVNTLQDHGGRGNRADDKVRAVLDKRIAEFMQKTMPVIETYRRLKLLVPVNAHDSKDTVYARVVDAVADLLAREAKKPENEREIRIEPY